MIGKEDALNFHGPTCTYHRLNQLKTSPCINQTFFGLAFARVAFDRRMRKHVGVRLRTSLCQFGQHFCRPRGGGGHVISRGYPTTAPETGTDPEGVQFPGHRA